MTPHALSELIRGKCLFSYARSGGPGGQNVNKVATKVIARLPLSAVSFLTEEGRGILEMRLARRINAEGQIVVAVQDTREQARNREIAVRRMSELISMALRRPRKRVATRPSGRAREARLRSKKLHSAAKRLRRVEAQD
ncbi:MAG TPA: alternative ribosome rescue aminoacyl-tRNA hydrolase ArfB [Spirochaetia bacterium]|nr:alternative ribosome rescue aminoacyl-tRNA hydrolase ArfB [Spirochaetia bacterium]